MTGTARYARIAGVGHYIPERVVTNHDLELLMDTSDAWIQERSGIRERHFAADDQACSDLAVIAARNALANAGWMPGDVDFVVFATLSPDYYFPGNGVLLQRKLGLGTGGALDVRTQCTGFVYGLSVADSLIRTGVVDRVLLVGAELHSAGLRLDTAGRDTAVLFGDGAGAVCLEVTDSVDGSRLLHHRLHADGKYAEALCMLQPGSAHRPWISKEMIDEGTVFPTMNGREVFKHAVTRFPEVIHEVLALEGVTVDQLDLVIPHQARVYSNIARYGNTTAASIPIALSETVADGHIGRGSLVCLAAFGSGFTWGASLLRY